MKGLINTSTINAANYMWRFLVVALKEKVYEVLAWISQVNCAMMSLLRVRGGISARMKGMRLDLSMTQTQQRKIPDITLR